MDNKPVIFFASLMLVALVLVVIYQVKTDPFQKTKPAVQQQQQSDPHGSGPGMAMYRENCASCHGAFGEGKGQNPSLQATKLNHDQIHNIIRNGRGNMPSFEDLTDQQVHQLVQFVEKL